MSSENTTVTATGSGGGKPETCIHCHETIYFNFTIKDEWTHWHGDSYCHTQKGFCNSKLKRAQPAFHPQGAVL